MFNYCKTYCQQGYSQMKPWIPGICLKDTCPSSHEQCAVFLCVPKPDKTEETFMHRVMQTRSKANCVKAVFDIYMDPANRAKLGAVAIEENQNSMGGYTENGIGSKHNG